MKIKYAIDFFLLVFRRESGPMTLPFAIMFPMLLMFFLHLMGRISSKTVPDWQMR